MTDNIFLNLSVLLAVTATVAFIVRLFRQPLVVAYLVAGVLVGPVAFNVLHDDGVLYRAFADLGVVLLLFVVGLSLNLRHLREIGRSAMMAGLGQFLFASLVGFLLLLLLPLPMPSRIYLAVAITFSSTIVMVKLLTDKGDSERLYGRNVIGLMVVQDLIAMTLLLALSVMGSAGTWGFAIVSVVIRALALIIGLGMLGRFLLPKILDVVARSSEHLFLTTIAWCLGVASVVHLSGFSLELGALAAGLSLAASPYQPEIASRIRPLRDFFLVLFFLVLGATMSFSGIDRALTAGLVLSAFILIGNPVILYLIYRWIGFTRRNSFLAGVTAAQVSEFGFVLLLAGQRLGHIAGDELSIFTITALVTIVGSTYLVTYNEQLFHLIQPFLARFRHDHHGEEPSHGYDAWVFGYHRIGWKIVEALRQQGKTVAAVDDDPAAIQRLRDRNIPGYFGDVSDDEFLESLPCADARLVVSTIPNPETSLVLLRHVRAHLGTKVRVVVTADHIRSLDPLYKAGADFVLLPHLIGGVWASDAIIEKPWTSATFDRLRKEQTEEIKLRTVQATM